MPHYLSPSTYWTPTRSWVGRHKVWSAIIALVLISIAWFAYERFTSTAGETRYVLGTVSSSTIIATISGSGQVSPSDQVEVKPKASGEITSVLVKEGELVVAGQAIAYIDAIAAQKSVRDAKTNLESAEISLEKLKKPATPLSLTQAQNALQTAQDELAKLYSDSQTDVVNAFLDLPNILISLQDIAIGTDTNTNTQWNIDFYENAIVNHDIRAQTYRDTAYNDYIAAKKSYDTAFANYQSLRDSSDPAAIEKLLNDTNGTVQLVSKATKSLNAFIQFYKDTLTTHNGTPSAVAESALEDLNTHTGTLNTHLSTLLSDTTTLKSNKQTITEKQQSLAETQSGADTLDIQSSQLNVDKAQNALIDAQTTLADYTVRAPFAGTIAQIDIGKGDQASPGTAVATLITKDQIAELSMNEVDAARLEIGQPVQLSFDALEDLTLSGNVAEIDTVGTVSQGVVSYAVKIAFDTQDTRVKPGMTVNADIQTGSASGLAVPATAIKSLNGKRFVLVFNPPLETEDTRGPVIADREPKQMEVEVGLTDDTNTQILSGLEEGMQIVIRQTNGAAPAGQQAPSIFGAPGGGRGGGGGAVRVAR